MTTLDARAKQAAKVWYTAHFNGMPNTENLVTGVLTAYLESLPPQPVEVTEEMVEAALHGRVPGGSSVWVWIAQDDAFKPSQTARDVIRSALEAALRGASGSDEIQADRAEIIKNVAIYTIEDEGDHVYLTAFGTRLGRWQLDTPEAVAVLKLCTVLRLNDGEYAEQRALIVPQEAVK